MRIWRVFSIPAFTRYWFGDLGSGLTAEVVQVALMWYLTTYGHSPRELGWYVFFSAAPVVIGGPLVAHLFRRLPVRAVMVLDLAVRGLSFGFLAIFLLSGHRHAVSFWAFDLVAVVTALMFMATSAGGPSLWPRLLPERELGHAMQAEQLGWNLAAALGPLLAGLCVTAVGLTSIAAWAAMLFAASAVNLATIPLRGVGPQAGAPRDGGATGNFAAVLRTVQRHQALWLTTALFWTFNLVGGLISVFLPLIVDEFWHGGAWLYGLLLATGSFGGIVGSLTLAGWSRGPLLRKVLLLELLASLTMLLLLPGLGDPVLAFAALAVSSAIGAATATWVLQLRFEATEEGMRPLVLSYIRTALWTASPLGGLLAGLLWRPAWAGVVLAAGVAAMALASLGGLALTRGGSSGTADAPSATEG